MCPSRTVINSWGSSALVMFSSTVLESWKPKQTYFGIMRWLLGTRLSYSVPVRGSECDVCLSLQHRSPVFCVAVSPGQSEMLRSLARMNLVSRQHAMLTPCCSPSHHEYPGVEEVLFVPRSSVPPANDAFALRSLLAPQDRPPAFP